MIRRVYAALAATALVLALLPALAGTGSATQGPNRFTAADLSSYQTNGIAWAVAQAGGRVFVGGAFSSVRPSGAAPGTGEVARANFAVFNAATGALDACAPRFELPSSPSSSTIRSLSVSPDQRTLYVGGFFSTINGGTAQHLAAIDIASCAVVSSFKPTPNGLVRAIASTGSVVYFGGPFSVVAGATRNGAAAVSAVATATPGSLLPWAPSFDKEVRTLALKPDASVVVAGGEFDRVNGASSHALAVVNASTGANVHVFGSLIDPLSFVMDLAADATGFYTAHEGRGAGVMDGRMAFNWSTYSTRWIDECLGATQAVEVYDSILYSGSHAHDCTSVGAFPDGPRTHLLAQSVNDPTLLPWFPDTNDGIGEALGPRDVVAARTTAGDFLWVVGEFTTVNGRGQQGITRFGQSAQTVGPSVPHLSVTYPAPGQARVAWRTSLDRDDATLTYRLYRGSTLLQTTTGTSWFWSRRQLTYTDSGLAVGSWQSYRLEVSDGTNTATTGDRWVQIGSGASSGYAERVLADGASFLWRYDDPLDVFVSDRSGNNNNGTIRGVITKVPGALAGDPSSGLTVPGGPAAPGGAAGSTTIYGETRYPAPGAFTAETWFKTTTNAGGKLIGFGTSQIINSWDSDRHIYMTNSGQLTFGTGPGAVTTSSRAYNDGAWHHVAATQGASGMALYVDGALVGSHSQPSGRAISGFWRVGGDNLNYWPDEPSNHYWEGALDETAVYPSALTPSTVADHYRLGIGSSTVSDTTPPSTPTGVAASVSGSTVAVSWTASTDNVGVSAYDVHRSATSGFSPTSSTLVGSVAGTSFSNRDVSEGTWYYRVIAKDAAGNNSAPSVQATATVAAAADTAAPSSPTGVATNVSGATVNVSWTASTDNVGVSAYDVHRSSMSGFTPSSSTVVGSVTGTSFSNISVPEGSWYYRVVAKDAAGNQSAPSAQASATVSSAPAGTSVTIAPAADTFVHASDRTTNYGASTSLAAYGTPDVQSYLRFVLPPAPTGQVLTGATMQVRTTGLGSAGSANTQQVRQAQNTWSESAVTYNTKPAVFGAVLGSLSAPKAKLTTYGIALSPSDVSPLLGSTVSLAVLGTGKDSFWFTSREGAVADRPSLTLQFSSTGGDPPPAADTSPPSAPSGVTTSVSGSTVTVSWAASTDNVGVTGYDVHRSSTSGFTPTTSTAVGSVSGTSFGNSSVPTGTWYYRVVAKDAAGNNSAPSSQAGATVATSTAPTTVTVTPMADTYANEGAPATNYGTSAWMASRGSLGYISYLRFAVPAAPAGTTLTGAVLRIRTTTDSFAGSTVSHTVQLASDSWAETTLTWNNRPALTSSSFGTTPAGTVPDTVYDTRLGVSNLQALAGSQATLAITSAGTSDNLWFWSSNHATASDRPQLILTYS